MLRPQHLDGRDDVMCYEKMHSSSSPHDEQLPMLLQQSRGGGIDASSRGGDFELDTVTCQLHGTTFTARECPYGVLPARSNNINSDLIECPYATLPRCCQCVVCADNMRTTLQNCNLASHEQTRANNAAEEDTDAKQYECGQSLKSVRFATINSKRGNMRQTAAQNLGGKPKIVQDVKENSPDIVPPAPAENETNELREQQISTFKSL